MFYKVLTFEGIKFVPKDKVQSVVPIGKKYLLIRYVDDGFSHNILAKSFELSSLEEMLDLLPKTSFNRTIA